MRNTKMKGRKVGSMGLKIQQWRGGGGGGGGGGHCLMTWSFVLTNGSRSLTDPSHAGAAASLSIQETIAGN